MTVAGPKATPVKLLGAHRLVAAHYPVTGILDNLANPEDLPALLELESWSDDRVSNELGTLLRLPRIEWVTGKTYSHIVMATFCHPAPAGGRFNDSTRGAWYAAKELDTAHAEALHRRIRALEEIGAPETRLNVRLWLADFDADFHDLTPKRRGFASFYDDASYAASQQLARSLLPLGSNGVLYRSVRRATGTCLACFRPQRVQNVREGGTFEYFWSGRSGPEIRKLSSVDTATVEPGEE